ncbi:MAG: flagellar biosynthesis protein FlhF, partial [Gammaproteobacteria bacterium]|nr:flagellar biosynthesis protein FlhF [Gammaproteobacteria bacterium]
MSVRRFVGANSRDVMRQVRETLGEDALIVANRRTEGGVEILAMADEAIDQFEPSPEPSAPETPSAIAVQDPMQAMSERLLREMQEMRQLLANNQPVTAPLPPQAVPAGTTARLRQLLWNVGFSSELSDEVLAGLPAPWAVLSSDSDAPLQWLRHLDN